MASKQLSVYWDSCLFLYWINDYPGRVDTIEGMWREVTQEKDGRIVTSSLSIAEVAFAESEANRERLNREVDSRIRGLWQDPKLLIVEASSYIMYSARDLMRNGIEKGWRLKGYDAIHLATAKFMETNGFPIQEFNTYDKGYFKFQNVVNMTICEPHHTPKPRQLKLLEK